jgi:hypothetical protein
MGFLRGEIVLRKRTVVEVDQGVFIARERRARASASLRSSRSSARRLNWASSADKEWRSDERESSSEVSSGGT